MKIGFIGQGWIGKNYANDFEAATGGDWKSIRDALIHDPRIGTSHTEPVQKSGRGAGGHCFIKDFEAFRAMYDKEVKDGLGSKFLAAMKDKNIQLLLDSNKDVALVEGVYGKNPLR